MGGPQQDSGGQDSGGQDSKASVRAAVRSQRRARTLAERVSAADDLARTVMAHLDGPGSDDGAGAVAAYASMPTEPGTGPLRLALADAGVTVLLPVVGAVAGRPLGWVVDGTDGPGAGSLADASLVLLPALAVTASGHRLGQGGGHYDRTLAALHVDPARAGAPGRRPLLVALVHDEEVLDDGAWPVEEHDAGVDAVATPSRWILLVRADPPAHGLRATTPPRPPHP